MNNLFNQKILLEKANNEIDLSKHNLGKRRESLNKWINLLENGVLEKSKEEEFQGEFLYDIFTTVLNATNKSDGKNEWNLERETKTNIDGQKADGVLGFFDVNGKADVRAVIELKGAKISLDHRQKRVGDTRTPVEQAFNYAPKYGKNCAWVIVSNYKEIRLYRANDMTEYEVFFLEKLKDDLEFKKFIYVMSFFALVGTENKKAKTLELSEEYQKNQREIEKKFYNEYKAIRINIFENMKKNNPQINELILIEKVQKLLDRFLFICFCEDKDLLPSKSFERAIERGKIFEEIGIFETFKMLCNWINSGNAKQKIPHFNGGLFKADDILDALEIDDFVFEEMKKIANYDFDSDLNENILGHIFEQSISDLEELKTSIVGEEFDKKKTKRKKDGIFYTPKYITKYIVETTINSWLADKRKELGEENLPKLTEEDEEIKYRSKASSTKIYTKNYQKHIDFWKNYKEAIKNIKILDPACGSGAFLIAVYDFLKNYMTYLDNKIFDLTGEKDLFSDITKDILENNIYGVDLNKESVEITKLSLWLKTADKNKTLATLENNIKCGNSLIDDENIAGELAFKWEDEFPEIMENGGFDIVVGNPPYGVNFNIEQKKYLENFDELVPDYEIYIYFISLCKKIIKNNGYLSYIFPNTFCSNLFAIKYRKDLFENKVITEIVNLSEDKTFEEASVRTIILTLKNSFLNDYLTNFSKVVDKKIIKIDEYFKNELIINIDNIFNLFFQSKFERKIIDKILSNNKLNEFFEVSQGLIPYDKYRGHSEETIKNRAYHSNYKKDETYKCELKGGDVISYYYKWNEELWISYGKWLAAPREEKFFKSHRILIREITAEKLQACYIEEEFYNTPSLINIINEKNELNLKYLLVILNSKLISWLHNKNSPKANKGLFPKILINDVRNIPIKQISLEEQTPFIEKANLMLELHKNFNNLKEKFTKNIQREFNLEKISKKLNDWYLLEYKDFLKEIEKNKIKLSLAQKAEWEEYFEIEKKKIIEIKNKISQTDKIIDKMVYELYNLTDEEIRIVEEN